MADNPELPQSDSVSRARFELELRSLAEGRNPDEQFLEEARPRAENAWISGYQNPKPGRLLRAAAFTVDVTLDAVEVLIYQYEAHRRNKHGER